MDILIRVGYAVMILAVVFCLYFTKKQQGGIRKTVDRFAFAYVKISNHVSPRPPAEGLLVEEADGGVRVLPPERQPAAVRTAIERAGSDKAVKLYREMMDAMLELENRCGRQRRLIGQFRDPLQALFGKARLFLTGCEHPENIRTMEDKRKFDGFLMDQEDDRMVLLRRISGGAGEQYRALNKHYDLAARERAEQEAKQKKRPRR